MANNCMNYITINGNIEEINELSKLLKVEGEENESSIYTNLCDHFGKQGNDARWFNIQIVRFWIGSNYNQIFMIAFFFISSGSYYV